ncbi:MAG: hypothetical protein ACPG6V_09700 [Flavobacteriales bacterium]
MNKPELITAGTFHYTIYTYRTEDGMEFFKFSYHEVDDGYEVDIHYHPDFGHRSTSPYTIHTLSSSRDQVDKMICFTVGKKSQTFSGAQEMSRHWAEMIHLYIQTGETIDEQIAKHH